MGRQVGGCAVVPRQGVVHVGGGAALDALPTGGDHRPVGAHEAAELQVAVERPLHRPSQTTVAGLAGRKGGTRERWQRCQSCTSDLAFAGVGIPSEACDRLTRHLLHLDQPSQAQCTDRCRWVFTSPRPTSPRTTGRGLTPKGGAGRDAEGERGGGQRRPQEVVAGEVPGGRHGDAREAPRQTPGEEPGGEATRTPPRMSFDGVSGMLLKPPGGSTQSTLLESERWSSRILLWSPTRPEPQDTQPLLPRRDPGDVLGTQWPDTSEYIPYGWIRSSTGAGENPIWGETYTSV